jgi:hypothetical protein
VFFGFMKDYRLNLLPTTLRPALLKKAKLLKRNQLAWAA